MSKNPILHHYIPQFLLRQFSFGKKDRLYVFDKQTDKIFESSVRRVGAKKNLYDFIFNGIPMTMEYGLSSLDSHAASHIKKIIRDGCLHPDDPEERVGISQFVAVQAVRTPAHEETNKDLFERMEAWLRKEGMPDDYFKPDPVIGSGENARRAMMARAIKNAPKDFGPEMSSKDWILLKTSRRHPFIIGDHPLAMHNARDYGPRGNLGLKVEGIELYFPLSSQFTLGMLCPSIKDELMKGIQRFTEIRPSIAMANKDTWSTAIDMVESINTGKPYEIKPANVDFHNSLQILNAERFIFSEEKNFEMAKDMIKSNPEVRRGIRMQEGAGKF